MQSLGLFLKYFSQSTHLEDHQWDFIPNNYFDNEQNSSIRAIIVTYCADELIWWWWPEKEVTQVYIVAVGGMG